MKKEITKFESQFEESVLTLTILTSGSDSSAGKAGKEVLWTASQNIIAYIDDESRRLTEAEGRLEWLAEDSQRSDWIYDLKAKSIYRVRVRRKKLPAFEHYFQLLEVLDRDVSSSVLDEVLKQYEKPIIITDQELGEFEYNKELHLFDGCINWLGEEASVCLDESAADKDELSEYESLKTLRLLVRDAVEWDKKLRTFAAKKLVELANDWLQDSDEEDPDPITEESFASRISISELSVSEDGGFEAYYYDDDMFWGHIIIIDGNINGELSDAYIAG